MNKNTKAKKKATKKAKQHFHGKACLTGFADKAKNPDNKRKSPWKGAAKGATRRPAAASIELAAA